MEGEDFAAFIFVYISLRYSVYMPSSVEFNTTWIKTFSELVPLAGLASALVVTDSLFEAAFSDGFITHFTENVDLTVIARAEASQLPSFCLLTSTCLLQEPSLHAYKSKTHLKIYLCSSCFNCGWSESILFPCGL